MNYKRKQYKLLKNRLSEKRNFIQVISGPRQIGKTTLINQFVEDENFLFHYVSADSANLSSNDWLNLEWNNARLKLKNSEESELILIIDEIQRIEDWSQKVKTEWDSDTRNKINIKLVLLGSSTLMLQQGLTESLMGRFEIIKMPHWSYKEINEVFGVNHNEYVWFGGYPGAYHLKDDLERWKDYIKYSIIETTISKDVLMLKRIDKPALLRNLFELGSFYSGQILSFNKILGQLQDAGNTTTLSHYLELLNSAGILSGLQKFSNREVNKKASSPKFLVYNTALQGSQMKFNFSEMVNETESWGRLVESVIGAHLLNYSLLEDFKLYYWREGNYEVDFILEKNNKVVAIEVKSTKIKSISGMNRFKKNYNPEKSYFVSENGLSWQEFIEINPISLF